jgi:hypothetical protein
MSLDNEIVGVISEEAFNKTSSSPIMQEKFPIIEEPAEEQPETPIDQAIVNAGIKLSNYSGIKLSSST